MTDPAIILAAGASTRFETIKQVYNYGGLPLVARAVKIARLAGLSPVVVLGAHRQIVEPAVPAGIDTVVNPRWEEGMASSIRCGVEYALKRLDPDGLLLWTCDQPEVSPRQLQRLHEMCTADRASAAAYCGTVGIPACFPVHCVDDLLSIRGDRGARGLLRGERLDVESVPMPQAAYDVDTIADVEKVRQRYAGRST